MSIFELFHLVWAVMVGVALVACFRGYRKRNIPQGHIPSGKRFYRK